MFPKIFIRPVLIALVFLTTAPITAYAAQEMPSAQELWEVIQRHGAEDSGYRAKSSCHCRRCRTEHRQQ